MWLVDDRGVIVASRLQPHRCAPRIINDGVAVPSGSVVDNEMPIVHYVLRRAVTVPSLTSEAFGQLVVMRLI